MIVFLNFSCKIVVKKPGLFFNLICFFLYKLPTTSNELITSLIFFIASSLSKLKLSINNSTILFLSISLLKLSIINASILSISL